MIMKRRCGATWSKRMLFSGDRMELVRFINPAPFTTPLGKITRKDRCLAGVANCQKLHEYNPKTSLQDLMKENDYHKILNESGYSPD